MLSFLQDQNSEELPAEKKSNTATGKKVTSSGKKASSDCADKSQESEFLTVDSHGKQVRKTTKLLAVIFVIGLLCLGFMIIKSSPDAASAANDQADQTKVETAIARLTGVKTQMFNRMDEIVDKFYEFSDVPQVNVNELAKNPFELDSATNSSSMQNKPDARALWQQQLKQNSKGMQLWSIMQTHQGNRCMIDDEILAVGDSIRGFKVIQIGDKFVKLESDGVTLELKLSE